MTDTKDYSDSTYIPLDDASPDQFPLHLSKLKILTKLFDAQCDIGTEGRLSTFLAVSMTKEEDQFVSLQDAIKEDGSINTEDKRLVLLNIFVPIYEDFSLELVSQMPAIKMEASAIIHDILQTLKGLYIKASMIEAAEYAGAKQ